MQGRAEYVRDVGKDVFVGQLSCMVGVDLFVATSSDRFAKWGLMPE